MGVIAPLARDGLFWLGLALRLTLLAVAAPWVQTQWFVPFLASVSQYGLAPWDGFLAAGGDPAFPYGWTYLVAFFPGTWLGSVLGGAAGARIGLGLTVLLFDFVLLLLLLRLAGRGQSWKVMLLYWLSPVAIYIGYWHGQLDIFPTALLVASLLAIASQRYAGGGLMFGIAVASKLSMILPAPFIALYFLGRARLRSRAAILIGTAVASAALLFVPFMASPGFRRMVLQTPETAKTFSFALPIGPGLNLYILPLALLAVFYTAWRVRRLDFEMLWTFTGTAFLAFLLLTPASPGWAMWSLPFIVLHVARAQLTGVTLYAIFSFSFVGLQLLVSTGALALGLYDLTMPLSAMFGVAGDRLSSVLFTVMLASGAALAAQMFRRGIVETPFRAATRRPLLLGVSGDSGAGKDTLIECVAGMFGPGALAHVSGDDYHIWDRHKPMWQALTHLNPKANDLDAFAGNVRDLSRGRAIRAPHYDHASGRMTKPVRIAPAEIIAACGLHALWSPALNALYDVRIYLDMDEDLRRFLKVKRDVHVRGHLESKVLETIEGRMADARRFIHPQADHADIVLHLEPRHRSALADYTRALSETPLRLIVTAPPGEDFDQLARLLASRCGIQVIERPLDSGKTEILIEGEATAQDIASAARRLAPDIWELLDVEPKWEAGLKGALQLIVLDQLNRASRRRRASA